jgi:formate dehydrogenase subunit gamma
MATQQKATPTPPGKVLRFTGGERFSHWVHAISFFLLLFTGLGVLSEFVRPAMGIMGGIQVARIIHRVMAVLFVVGTGAMFFINDPKYHWEWIRTAFQFTDADIKHIKAFAAGFFGGHGNYPPQAKYNGGEKINSLFTIFGSVFITGSGIVMWFPQYFPMGLVQTAYPIHDLAMFMMTTSVIGHMYLSLLHPESRVALPGMVQGYVSENFAKAHHGAWYEEIKQKQQAGK